MSLMSEDGAIREALDWREWHAVCWNKWLAMFKQNVRFDVFWLVSSIRLHSVTSMVVNFFEDFLYV